MARLVFLLLLGFLVFTAKSLKTRNPNALLGEFPHQVSIIYRGRHFCGGALITEKHALTAAHCVKRIIDDRFKIRGYNNGRSIAYYDIINVAVEVGTVKMLEGKSHAVERLSYHQSYRERSDSFTPNDIGVVKLRQGVKISKYVKPIGLPRDNEEIPLYARVVVTGFGSSVNNGANSKKLRKMTSVTLDNRYCQLFHWDLITTSHVCTARTVYQGVCFGDSGSALVNTAKTIVYGIVSGGDPDCDSLSPDVYTKVSKYMDYVRGEISDRTII